MTMQFTVAITGDIAIEADASDLGLEETLNDSPNDLFDLPSHFDLTSLRAYGTVTVNAEVRVAGHEVEAVEMLSADAEDMLRQAINDGAGYSNSVSIDSAEFEVEDGPTGWEDVLGAVGYSQDTAIAVYVALAASGHEVI